jgi:hypothetical protein
MWTAVACLALQAPVLTPRHSPGAHIQAVEKALEPARIASALPFIVDPDLLAESVIYSGLDSRLVGKAAYLEAARAWSTVLPQRLRAFEMDSMTTLPPDARRVVCARWLLRFEAPVPPQVLPAQRARLARARLETTADGWVVVTAQISASLALDSSGRVVRHTETLVADPFSVTNSIAHFNLLNARAHARGGTPAALAEPAAYWAALRGMMRIELEEAVRRSQSDESAVLSVRDLSMTDEQFEQAFRWFILQNLLAGAALPAAVYLAVKAPAIVGALSGVADGRPWG